MRKRNQKLQDLMIKKGYPIEFCTIISEECSTEYTSKRMIGYICQTQKPSMESIVDEMLAIFSDRDRIVSKKIMESNQAARNRQMEKGFEGE